MNGWNSGSLLCLGLDPVVAAIPAGFTGPPGRRVADYLGALLEAIAGTGLPPGAVKLNIGFYAVLDRPLAGDFDGSSALAAAVNLVRRLFPNTEVILDSKRGDIARSGANYAEEAFGVWGADAMTASAYMGDDSVEVMLRRAREARGTVYLLAATSNPGASRFQQLPFRDGSTVADSVLDAIVDWHREEGSAGAVVGATHPEELRRALYRLSSARVPALIPGVGRQGAAAEEVLTAIESSGYPPEEARINVSSGITHPWKDGAPPEDWLPRVLDSYRVFWEALRVPVAVGG
ncbi:MAG: orotidine-5'-phosphate decarboxylase [Spirochaetaceae bacterium]